MKNRSLVVKAGWVLVILLIAMSTAFTSMSYLRERSMYFESLLNIEEAQDAQLELQSADIQAAGQKMSMSYDKYMADPANVRIQAQLEKMLTSKIVTNSYLMSTEMTTKDNKHYAKMMQANRALNEHGAKVLEDYELSAQFQRAYEDALKKGTGMTDVYTDASGTWISILSSIRTDKGETVAVFGLDFDYGLIQSDLNHALLLNILIGLAIGGLFIGLMIWLLIRTVRPLKRMAEVSKLAAEGDLSVSVPVNGRDEIGLVSEHFNHMVESIRKLVASIKTHSDEVAESSDLLTVSAKQTAEATGEAARAVEEVAAGAENQLQSAEECKRAMVEMATGIERIAESAGVVADLSAETSRDAAQGNEVVQQMIAQMNRIESVMTETGGVIHELRSRSEEVGEIMTLIADIANQTNLLALNASIEAARAGEHGKGFAVVAVEVRKLAEKSKESSEHIAALLREIEANTKRAVASMETGVNETSKGTAAAGQAGEVFGRILHAIQQVAGQVQEVSAASEEMSAGTEEVAASLEELARIAQEAADNTQNVAASSEEQLAAMEEISSASGHLKEMSVLLQRQVNTFKL
ncbi:methyl-accepting chemotaxis protein [Paenibacillus tyrfis]|uniref:methyl-accepting chemotaxis protein n=1 Tax=Paenibacillus tyrfis TaxID=1501230 RepID=UPI00209F5A3C|nr:HAMP domain-containing methyl-accepting chemotaxis protein [Paenibacillus tyrfis]MCP1310986.1 methyl-accepting chemotaxis protein [Paenibacillus tyrfis]